MIKPSMNAPSTNAPSMNASSTNALIPNASSTNAPSSSAPSVSAPRPRRRTSQPKSRRHRTGGFALVAVIGGLLLVSTIVFAMAFVATLDVMSARSSQTAVLAEAQAEGSLDAALADLAALTADPGAGSGDGVPPPPGTLGPWPELGLTAEVVVTVLPERWEGHEVVALLSQADVGVSRAQARAVVALASVPRVLWRP